jgi:hypothetical protein
MTSRPLSVDMSGRKEKLFARILATLVNDLHLLQQTSGRQPTRAAQPPVLHVEPVCAIVIVVETSKNRSKCVCSESTSVIPSNADAVTVTVCCVETYARQPSLSTKNLTGKGVRKRNFNPLTVCGLSPSLHATMSFQHEPPNLDRLLFASCVHS